MEAFLKWYFTELGIKGTLVFAFQFMTLYAIIVMVIRLHYLIYRVYIRKRLKRLFKESDKVFIAGERLVYVPNTEIKPTLQSNRETIKGA